MKVIRLGSKGQLVEKWQLFLIGEELLNDTADGVFGNNTKLATIEFQKKHGLDSDGIVGNSSYGKAMMEGFEVIEEEKVEPAKIDEGSADWPAKPNFQSLYNQEKRDAILGKVEFTADAKNKLTITNGWDKNNIITIEIPQLVGMDVYGRPKKNGKIKFHKVAAPQMIAMWAEWEKEGLLPLVKTWGGSYVPRFIRGSTTRLSNHTFGTAFDINVKWNGLAKRPALVGQEGSIRKLIPIANKFGFYWGGHFRRKDGMHFEFAKLIK